MIKNEFSHANPVHTRIVIYMQQDLGLFIFII